MVVEDIHANRLVVLAVKEKENEINIRLAQEGEVPDFLATRAIKEGEAVYVIIKNRETWKVEADATFKHVFRLELVKMEKSLNLLEKMRLLSSDIQ
ncbi:hypothetical protein ABEY41_01845 [Peribacillus butanolivorans]|uniref:hypothetical protein n=1 Tax=Peribacillus butanolivorans TaxID=421767 RepID=UPI003D285E04